MNIYMKWLLIVCLNAIVGFYFGQFDSGFAHLMGMISGILTWYFAYLYVDIHLRDTGRKQMSRKLMLSAILRIPLQLTVFPDMFAGVAAIGTVEYLGLDFFGSSEFISHYILTLFTGLYLSLLCSVIYGLITVVDTIRGKLHHP
jgi:hypothetical protein